MTRLILTAEVDNAAEWEAGFRTHVDLFKSQTTKTMQFGVGENNTVALYQEIEDFGKWQEILESPATAEAMATDGVKRETVQIYMLDKELDLS